MTASRRRSSRRRGTDEGRLDHKIAQLLDTSKRPDGREEAFVRRLLSEVVTPGGRLIVCGYGSPRSEQAPHPVRRLIRAYGFESEVELEREAPEGGGPIIEIAVLRAT